MLMSERVKDNTNISTKILGKIISSWTYSDFSTHSYVFYHKNSNRGIFFTELVTVNSQGLLSSQCQHKVSVPLESAS